MIDTEEISRTPPLFPDASFTIVSKVTATFFLVAAKSGKAIGGFNGDSKSRTLMVNLDKRHKSEGMLIIEGQT